MDAKQRKKVVVITRYAAENFSQGDWVLLGQLTGQLSRIQNHPRLFRSMGFGDDDYEFCAAEVLDQIFEGQESFIDEVIDHFDIDLWYEQKHPDKYKKLFSSTRGEAPKFWRPDCLKVFVSHLTKNRAKVSELKMALQPWGVTCFIAHQDIEPSREWQVEIEAALSTMDVLVAIIEPGFRDSAWTDQEVGYALGRGVDVVPILVGQDPHGFVGKIQGLQAKGKLPTAVATELVLVLLRKPRHRDQLLLGMAKSLAIASSEERIRRIRQVDTLITDQQMKALLERSGLSAEDRKSLEDIGARVGAFKQLEEIGEDSEDVPF